MAISGLRFAWNRSHVIASSSSALVFLKPRGIQTWLFLGSLAPELYAKQQKEWNPITKHQPVSELIMHTSTQTRASHGQLKLRAAAIVRP